MSATHTLLRGASINVAYPVQIIAGYAAVVYDGEMIDLLCPGDKTQINILHRFLVVCLSRQLAFKTCLLPLNENNSDELFRFASIIVSARKRQAYDTLYDFFKRLAARGLASLTLRQSDVADVNGISREVVNRVLNDMQDRGLVKLRRSGIFIDVDSFKKGTHEAAILTGGGSRGVHRLHGVATTAKRRPGVCDQVGTSQAGSVHRVHGGDGGGDERDQG